MCGIFFFWASRNMSFNLPHAERSCSHLRRANSPCISEHRVWLGRNACLKHPLNSTPTPPPPPHANLWNSGQIFIQMMSWAVCSSLAIIKDKPKLKVNSSLDIISLRPELKKTQCTIYERADIYWFIFWINIFFFLLFFIKWIINWEK